MLAQTTKNLVLTLNWTIWVRAVGLLQFRVGIIYLTLAKDLHYNVGADQQIFWLE
jgi:hypothetical protein